MDLVYSAILAISILAVIGLANWLILKSPQRAESNPFLFFGLVIGELIICIVCFLVLKNFSFFNHIGFAAIFGVGFIGLSLAKFLFLRSRP
jgi:hypothetical protein